MINKSVPNQPMLFDVNEFKMHPQGVRSVLQWVARAFSRDDTSAHAEGIEASFSETTGQPTKEFYSMSWFVFIMEFMDWTITGQLLCFIRSTNNSTAK